MINEVEWNKTNPIRTPIKKKEMIVSKDWE